MTGCVSEQKRVEIMRALERYPDGATAIEIAKVIGRKPGMTSQRMGAMFFEGTLERENVHKPAGREYRYRIRAPKTAPEQWKPELRLAERLNWEDERV